jgi:hypothetical protein
MDRCEREEPYDEREVPVSGIGYLGAGKKKVRYFEWSSKTLTNLMYALFNRQLATPLRPDPRVIEGEFKQYAIRQIDRWTNLVVAEGEDWTPMTVTAWINSHEGWGRAKRQKYYVQMVDEYDGKGEFPVVFEAMVKSGEQYYTLEEYDFHCRWLREPSRPRLIFVPVRGMCGNMARMNEPLINLLKKVEPAFIHGMNSDQYKAHNITHLVKFGVKLVPISTDGSNHDGHQHWKLIELIDNYYWRQLMPFLRTKYDFTDKMWEGIDRQITSLTARLDIYDPTVKKRTRLG